MQVYLYVVILKENLYEKKMLLSSRIPKSATFRVVREIA